MLSNNNGWDTGPRDHDFTISMNMWWGNNGTLYNLYGNGVLIHTQNLTDDTLNGQRIDVPITGKVNGTYSYTCELTNRFGTNSMRRTDRRCHRR